MSDLHITTEPALTNTNAFLGISLSGIAPDKDPTVVVISCGSNLVSHVHFKLFLAGVVVGSRDVIGTFVVMKRTI